MESTNRSESRKSRNQKFYEFFIVLQKEYIVAELRSKIYKDAKGKQKSEEIMKGKKAKIYDIALKNNLKTIFPEMKLGAIVLYDPCLDNDLHKEIYREGGLPNFIYRDETQKSILEEKDKKSYFEIRSKFMVLGIGQGILISVDFNKNTGIIGLNRNNKELTFEYSLDNMMRVFPVDYP